jgi:hypothetical protein
VVSWGFVTPEKGAMNVFEAASSSSAFIFHSQYYEFLKPTLISSV